METNLGKNLIRERRSWVVISTRNVTWVGDTHVPQELKQGAALVAESPTNTMFSASKFNMRFPKSSAHASPAKFSFESLQLLPLMNLKSKAPSAIESGINEAQASQMPSPSASVIGVPAGSQPWKLPATCTPFGDTASSTLMSTRRRTVDMPQAAQLA